MAAQRSPSLFTWRGVPGSEVTFIAVKHLQYPVLEVKPEMWILPDFRKSFNPDAQPRGELGWREERRGCHFQRSNGCCESAGVGWGGRLSPHFPVKTVIKVTDVKGSPTMLRTSASWTGGKTAQVYVVKSAWLIFPTFFDTYYYLLRA